MNRVLQITDCHLQHPDKSPNKAALYYDKLKRLCQKLNTEPADFILVTGDISDDGTKKSYQSFCKVFSGFSKPIYCLPGNHDRSEILKNTCLTYQYITFFNSPIKLGSWVFIPVNTVLPKFNKGYISDKEYKEVLTTIHNYSNYNVALVMHHQPIPVKTPSIDKYMVENHDQVKYLFSASNIKLVIFGHVHNDYEDTSWKNVLFSSAPATCFQMEKGRMYTKVKDDWIGYKEYIIQRFGKVETKTKWFHVP